MTAASYHKAKQSVTASRPTWYDYWVLARLNRPIGILLLLWPTLIALWLASDNLPRPRLIIIFTLGAIIMRSAGCIINDWADRHIDGRVERTRLRPLVTGKITSRAALGFFFGLLLLALILVLTTNFFTIFLSLGALAIASCYPFMKRYTHFPQVVLGAAFGWAIPMAYAATLNFLPLECWLLFSATLLWAIAYDTIYAMVDKADDLKIGVKSTAIAFGKHDKLAIAACQAVMLGLFVLIGWRLKLAIFFYLGIMIALILFLYQHYLIKDRNPQQCWQAFLNNQWVGLALFVGTLLAKHSAKVLPIVSSISE